MPTYVYKCKSCDHQFELFQKMSDEPVKVCPECQGEVVRLLFPPAISFKGSGFHVNDYPNTKSMASGKSESKSDTAATKS